MLFPRFDLTIGTYRFDSRDATVLNLVNSVRVILELNSAVNFLTLELTGDYTSVHGDSPSGNNLNFGDAPFASGDKVTLALGYEDDITQVFSGTLDHLYPGIETLHLQAFDSGKKLLDYRTNQIYEQSTAGDIVADLASQIGVSVDQNEAGIEYPFYTVDETKNVFEHMQDLAQQNGFDLYINAEDALVFKKYTANSPVKTFTYSQDILTFNLHQQPAQFQKITVCGESPASSEGMEKAHWLSKKNDDSLGQAGTDAPGFNIYEPTIKTKDAADVVAEARLEKSLLRQNIAFLKTLGTSDQFLGDPIGIQGLFGEESQPYKVIGITHQFDKTKGFITDLMLQGQNNG